MADQGPMDRFDESHGEFRIHYHLVDDKHQMDALVRNQCETEVLATVIEVARTLGISCRVETRAYGEGGLQEFLALVGQYRDQIATLVAVLVPLFGFANWAVHIKGKNKLTKQQVQLNELVIEKMRLELRKMRHEDANGELDSATGSLPLEPTPTPEEIASALIGQKRVAVRRSNFYRKLLLSDEVTAVGFARAHAANSPESYVERNKFADFIVDVGDLEPTRLEKVPVEIISPVLRAGSNKWRGLLDKRSFTFDLADRDFLDAVLSRRVQFQNGTTLLCDMEVLLRENEQGEVETVGHVVTQVHDVLQAAGSVSLANEPARTYRSQAEMELRHLVPVPPATRARLVQRTDGTEEIDDSATE
jgi:hypothetical protein